MTADYEEDGTAKKKRQIRIRVKREVTDPDDVVPEPNGDIVGHIRKLITEGERRLQNLHAATPEDQTIGPHVETFLAFKRSQAEAGERSQWHTSNPD